MKGSPLDGVPTGDAGVLADAISPWDELEPGKRIKDYTISRAE